MNEVLLVQETLESESVQQLFQLLNEELNFRYPEANANHFTLSDNDIAQNNGALYIAYVDSEAVGCIAIRKVSVDTMELKRLFVLPSFRKNGIARCLYNKVEELTRSFGCKRLVLETGDRQPETITGASSVGFERIPPFGEYIDSPLSVCMGKEI